MIPNNYHSSDSDELENAKRRSKMAQEIGSDKYEYICAIGWGTFGKVIKVKHKQIENKHRQPH